MPDKTHLPTIKDLLADAAIELRPRRIICEEDRDLGHFEAEILLEHVLKRDRAWIIAHQEEPMERKTWSAFQKLVRRRKTHEPIAYILGHKDFYGQTFLVNRATLIPRPESELLVERALRAHRTDGVMWDVGTGSGALGISLAKNIKEAVLATDISARALTTAKKNAKRLGVQNIHFSRANLVGASVIRFLKQHTSGFDVIIANLPYLPTSDRKKLDPDVTKYEPSSALFSGKDGLTLIARLLQQLARKKILFKTLLLEYDPPQTKILRALVQKYFPESTIAVHKDLAGRDRVMEISNA